MTVRIRFATAAVVFIVAPIALPGQETRASIVGTVRDQSGAVIPGVSVEVTNVASNVALSAKSNGEGAYAIPYLLPGTYRVTAGFTGFKTFVRDNIELRIADRVEIDIGMQVGDSGEKLTVTAATPILQTADASMGQVVDDRRLAQMPIDHGQPYALIALTPGVAYTKDLHFATPFEANNSVGFTMDGVPSLQSTVTLDGSPNTVVWNPGGIFAGYTPPADILQEMKVQTLNVDASVGHTMGGVTSLTTKAGGNRPHGTAYWFGRNPALDANLFFANAAGQAKPDFAYNQWGGSFTGPVFLPKLYDGRNRTFFTYGYEDIHETRPRGVILTVPTAAERQGDFSALLKVGAQYQIYDPSTRQPAPNGRYTVQPLPGNIIPAGRISPIATNILSYWSLPNVPGTPDGSLNLNKTNEAEVIAYANHLFRIDQNFSSKHRAFVRGNTYNKPNHRSQFFDNVAAGIYADWWSYAISLDDVYELSPSNIVNTRVSFIRHDILRTPPPGAVGFDLTKLGFPKSFNDAIDPSVRAFPYLSIPGYFVEERAFDENPDQTASAELNMTSVRGSHILKYGADARILRHFQYAPGQSSQGQFTFGTSWTQGPFDNSAPSPLGQGLASMLLGLPTGGQVTTTANFAEQSTVYSLYLQDDWKITPRLTLNLGLRYELEGPMTERFNRSVRGYDFQTPSPLNPQVQANYALNPIPQVPAGQFQLVGGPTFAGVGGQSRALWNRDADNIMPRFGLAYRLGSATVLRGGYGMFYGSLDYHRANVIQTGFSQTTPLVPSLDNGLTFVATLANPFPNGIQAPRGAAGGLLTNVGQGIAFFNQNPQAPREQRWHVGIQRVLPQRVLLEVSYVGNHGNDLETTHDYRPLPLQYLSLSPTRDQATINFLSQQLPNPFYPLLPGTGLAGQTVARSYLLSSGNYAQFTGMTSTDSNGYSWYHSLQVKVERRFGAGWSMTVAYSWSKYLQAIDRLNPYPSALNYVVSDEDRPQRIVVSGIWELPFGKGKKFLSHTPAVVSTLVGGWQAQGIYTGQAGQALSWGNVLFLGDVHDIRLPKDQRAAREWFNINAGFVKQSAQQLANNWRTFSSRLNNVRGPGLNNFDFSALKNTHLREKLTLQFRFEMLNALNHPIFGNPNTDPTSTAFGTINGEAGYTRRVRFGAKLLF